MFILNFELGLYTSPNFGNVNALISYLEWGSAGHGRASLAIEAGLWMQDFFLTPASGDESLQLSINDDNELAWVTKVATLCGANDAATSTEGETEMAILTLFPNPVNEVLNVEVMGVSGEESEVEIFDFSGRRIFRQSLKAANGLSTINLTEAPAGAYILRLVNGGQVATRRFTVR